MDTIKNSWEEYGMPRMKELIEKINKIKLDKNIVEKTVNVLTSLPNLISTMAGKHVDGCQCEYCQPQKDVSAVQTRQCDYFYQKFEPSFHCSPKQQDNYKLKNMTKEEQKAYYNHLQETYKKLPPLAHPEWASSSITTKCIQNWLKQYDKDNKKKQASEQSSNDIKSQPLKGMLVFYVYVGRMELVRVEKYVDKYKEKMKPIISRIPPGWEFFCIPIREGDSRIETIVFKGDA
jgi:hypothetical protein